MSDPTDVQQLTVEQKAELFDLAWGLLPDAEWLDGATVKEHLTQRCKLIDSNRERIADYLEWLGISPNIVRLIKGGSFNSPKEVWGQKPSERMRNQSA